MLQTGQRVQGVGTHVAEGPEMVHKVTDEVVVENKAHQVGAGLSTRGSVSASPSSGTARRGSKNRDVLRPPRSMPASMLVCVRDETQ